MRAKTKKKNRETKTMLKHIITIEMDPKTGKVSMSAPLDNKVLCYGMLAVASEIVASSGSAPKLREKSTPIVGGNGKPLPS